MQGIYTYIPETNYVPRELLLLLLLLLLLSSSSSSTAIELSLGGSSPYTSTDKTNKNKYTQTKQYKKAQYKQHKTQYKQVHILPKDPHITKPTHTHTTTHYTTQHTLIRRFEASDVADGEGGFSFLRVRRSNRIKGHTNHFNYTSKSYSFA